MKTKTKDNEYPRFSFFSKVANSSNTPGTMTEIDINSLLTQIRDCVYEKDLIFHCCGQLFPNLFGLKKHLMEYHQEDYRRHFKHAIGCTNRKLKDKIDIHQKAIQGEQKLYERMRQVKGYDEGASPTVGLGFHIIYTPMGNKR